MYKKIEKVLKIVNNQYLKPFTIARIHDGEAIQQRRTLNIFLKNLKKWKKLTGNRLGLSGV